tara:strand:- start:526 stop:750 length:225 start_codon:yes stop_codon:yes gene_type:complete
LGVTGFACLKPGDGLVHGGNSAATMAFVCPEIEINAVEFYIVAKPVNALTERPVVGGMRTPASASICVVAMMIV